LREIIWGSVGRGAASGVGDEVYGKRTNAKTAGIIGTGWPAQAHWKRLGRCESWKARGCMAEMSGGARICARDDGAAEDPVPRCGELSGCRAEARQLSCGGETSASRWFFGADLACGAHVNAIGANHMRKRELDDACSFEADAVVGDYD